LGENWKDVKREYGKWKFSLIWCGRNKGVWKEGHVDVDIFHPNQSKAILSNWEEKFREKTNIS
jgi:hypothetical protein